MVKRGLSAGAALVAVLMVFVFALVGSAGAMTAARADVQPVLDMGPVHWYGPGGWGNWGPAPPPPAPPPPVAVDPPENLSNPGNGEIMPTTRTHLIFWLPAGFHYSSSVGDANYENQMIKYFKDVGGSQILNTTTQPGSTVVLGRVCPVLKQE
jgi:hypothetical protein